MRPSPCKPKKRSPGGLEVVGAAILFGGAAVLLRFLIGAFFGDHAEANIWAGVAALLVWLRVWDALGWE